MRGRYLSSHIFFACLAITLAALVAAFVFMRSTIRSFELAQTAAHLKDKAALICDDLDSMLGKAGESEIDAKCKILGRQTSTRVTVILPDGKVLGDSEKDPLAMENHGDRPEVREAMAGRMGQSSRYSDTLGQTLVYLGYPLVRDGKVEAVVRTSVPLISVSLELKSVYWKLGAVLFAILVFAAAASFLLSRSVTRPLEEIRRGAERVSRGDFDLRLEPSGCYETSSLAASMNNMAAQLDERLRAISQQRNELEAVLSSLVEGVLAVDTGGRILRLNEAAASLLDVPAGAAQGRMLLEVIRNLQLHEFASRVLASAEPVEEDIVLQAGGQDRFIQARGMALRNSAGDNIGALIVLNDVTRIRHLEEVRKDFVANASHELKTPIASLRGFVETLQEGAAKNPDDPARFLDIIARQTDRLDSLIDDILALSRIEHDADRNLVELKPGRVADVLRSAVDACSGAAKLKNMTVKMDCDPGLTAMMNVSMLEHAVVNLLDNAVKYSGEGTTVEVGAVRCKERVEIRVRDQGLGMEKQHLSRIFERFYRIDKGRSRQLGGTGLGLSIVKHVALAHRGSVEVESVSGKGSTFTICIMPCGQSANG